MPEAAHPPADSPAAASGATANFADRLHAAIARTGSPACVGIDPVAERLPAAVRARHGAVSGAEQIEDFCKAVIDAVADSVGIVKPQSACFERFGQAGIGVLRRVIQHAHQRGLVVILDAKRGDIGSTAQHYAAAIFGPPAASRPSHAPDAITLNGYMGMDTVEPFLTHGAAAGASPGGTGAFILVRTSNPGSDAVQSLPLADGRTVAELLADLVAATGRAEGRIGERGLSCVGAVVGATKSSEAAALRARMPEQYLLIPGYGAQGGTLEDIRPMLRTSDNAADAGIVVNASRSVIFAFNPDDRAWAASVRDAAARFADDLRSLFK